MYRYFNGLIIREGTSDIAESSLKNLYVDAGWVSRDGGPKWQDEKFKLVLENSTWAFTVWQDEELVGMVRVISDKIMFATILDLIVKSSYRGKGIGQMLVKMCIDKLPLGTWYAHTTSNNYRFYEHCGLKVQDVTESGNCVYFGRRAAKEAGHL
jgi:ribosomal protein S18 acetylase RimI-like enzyme